MEFYTTVECFQYVFSKVMGPKQLKNWGEEWDYDLENIQTPQMLFKGRMLVIYIEFRTKIELYSF